MQKRHMINGGDIFPQSDLSADTGVRILLARLNAGLTQSALARKSGVSRRAIIAIEPVIKFRGGEAYLVRKGTRIPHATTVRKLARILLSDKPDPSMSDLIPSWPEASHLPSGFGEWSALRRESKMLTQAQLAAKVGVNVSSISRFERNKFVKKFCCIEQHPSDGAIMRLKHLGLAKALGFRSVAAHERWVDARERDRDIS